MDWVALHWGSTVRQHVNPIVLTPENVGPYISLQVIPALDLGPLTVEFVQEVSEHTYVNWIFHAVLRGAETRLSIYLRQNREHAKARPDVSMDPARGGVEARVLHLLGGIVPGVTPAILWHDRTNNVLALEDIRRGAPFLVDELKEGRSHTLAAGDLGRSIGQVHAATRALPSGAVHGSWEANAEARQISQRLRLGPAQVVEREMVAELVISTGHFSEGLVMGDLGSKNIFIDGGRARFLDFERSYVGDQAFDLGFLFAHYLVELPPWAASDGIAAVSACFNEYKRVALPSSESSAFEIRMLRWLGAMILYRTSTAYMGWSIGDENAAWRRRGSRLLRSGDVDFSSAIADLQ